MLQKEASNDFDWDLYKFVIRGKCKTSVLLSLNKKNPKTPTQIKKELGCWFNSSDRSLMELVKEGLTKCLNPEDKIGRLYLLTEKGQCVKDKILKSLTVNEYELLEYVPEERLKRIIHILKNDEKYKELLFKA